MRKYQEGKFKSSLETSSLVTDVEVSRHIDSLVRRLKHADARPPALPNTRSPEYHFVDVRGAFRLAGLRSHLAGRHSQAVERETARPSQDYPHCPPFDMPSGLDINAQMHAFLMDKYLNICHTVYPILEDDLPLLHDPSFVGTEIDPWQHFVLNMVYAIGCHCLAKNDPRLVMLSESCYRAAQMHFEGIMSELNTEALQAVLLLALYSLFDPQKGNIGQQIAFAHRLEVELTEREGENLGPTLSRLRKVTFCLGTQVSSVLDRSVGFHATELVCIVCQKVDAGLKICHRIVNSLSMHLTRHILFTLSTLHKLPHDIRTSMQCQPKLNLTI